MFGYTAHSSDYFLEGCTYFNIFLWFEQVRTSGKVFKLCIRGSLEYKKSSKPDIIEQSAIKVRQNISNTCTKLQFQAVLRLHLAKQALSLNQTMKKTVVRVDASKARSLSGIEKIPSTKHCYWEKNIHNSII